MIAGDLALQRRVLLSRGPLALAIVFGLVLAAALGLVFAFQASDSPIQLRAGEASPNTILAPDRVTYASEIQTEDARAKAETAINPVYDPPDANLARDRVRLASSVFNFIDSNRQDPYSSPAQKLAWVTAVPNLAVASVAVSQTIELDEDVYRRVVTETLYVLDVTMRDQIRPDDVSYQYTRIPMRVSLALSVDEADLVTAWVKALIVPNSFPNPQKTDELRAEARSHVGTVYRTIEKGEAILREGEVVTPLSIEALEATGLMRPQLGASDFAGPGLYALLLAVLLVAYLIRLRPAVFAYPRVWLLVVFLTVLFCIGIKVVSVDRTWLPYLLPLSAAGMLLAVLIDVPVALGVVTVLALAFGYFALSPLEAVTYALVGGFVGALMLGRIDRLQAFLWAGLYVAAANAAVISVFSVAAHETSLVAFGQALTAAVGNGALSGLVAFGSLFVLGKLFGITTSLELLDLARPTHPLLQRLLMDAPGTYHHSLIVGQLAEQAAHRIGADALLVRVGAYYHDVGKTANAHSFVENQLEGGNIHDTLDPKESASVVIDHVARGVALAKKYGVPAQLRDFIPQHHGTTLAAYFHRKAVQANGNQPVDEADYRYRGPKPQTREAAILMLADGVEATTRADRPSTPEELRAVIERIIGDRVRDGQLDECDLTLRDLDQIREAFFGVLLGLFHPRVKYPEPPAEGPQRIVNVASLDRVGGRGR